MSALEGWDRQIRLFAKHFLCHANLPAEAFTLLDVGCGTGAALGEIKRHYLHAQLFGCDFMKEHVEIARRTNGDHAQFYQSDIRDIINRYDIIYLSNILEHLTNWHSALDHALSLCRRLYILVPYKELLKKEQSGIPYVDHVASFHEGSFNFLNGRAVSIEHRVIRTPHAWGHPLKREMYLRTRAFFKHETFDLQREMLVAITVTKKSNEVLPIKPFKSRLSLINRFPATTNRQKIRR